MKHSTVGKMKFLKLKRRLSLRHWQTVGVLESLWLFVQQNAQPGDIGRYSNEDIVAAIEWEGDADELIAALIECGWLNDSEVHRLVVHDWPEHAPNWLKGMLKSTNQSWAIAPRLSPQAKPPGSKPPAKAADHLTQPNLTQPNLTQPNLTQPNLTQPNPSKSVSPKPDTRALDNGTEHFEEFWKAYPRKQAKEKALKAWKKLRPDGELIDVMLRAISIHRQTQQWREGIIPHPATWLNQRRWEDEDMSESVPAFQAEMTDSVRKFLEGPADGQS